MIEFFDLKMIDNPEDGSMWLAIMENGDTKTVRYSCRLDWVEMDYSQIYGEIKAVAPIKITEPKYPYEAGDLVKHGDGTILLLLEIIDEDEVKLMHGGKIIIEEHDHIFALTAREKQQYCEKLMGVTFCIH